MCSTVASAGASSPPARVRSGCVDSTTAAVPRSSGHGTASSPLIYGDSVIVAQDQRGRSFVAAFDRKTGEEKWSTKRAESVGWSTPIAVRVGDRDEIVLSGQQAVQERDAIAPFHRDHGPLGQRDHSGAGQNRMDLSGAVAEVWRHPHAAVGPGLGLCRPRRVFRAHCAVASSGVRTIWSVSPGPPTARLM